MATVGAYPYNLGLSKTIAGTTTYVGGVGAQGTFANVVVGDTISVTTLGSSITISVNGAVVYQGQIAHYQPLPGLVLEWGVQPPAH